MFTQSKALPIAVIILALFATGFYFISEYKEHSTEVSIGERNYVAEVYLKTSPNMYSRQPASKDIDTKLNFQSSDGSVYRLYESRDFLTYGKTFIVRVG